MFSMIKKTERLHKNMVSLQNVILYDDSLVTGLKTKSHILHKHIMSLQHVFAYAASNFSSM